MATFRQKLEQANENIETLIEDMVSNEENNNTGNCPHNENVILNCIHNCDKCKQDYYENLITEMREEFIVR